jgi:hypothetical protein
MQLLLPPPPPLLLKGRFTEPGGTGCSCMEPIHQAVFRGRAGSPNAAGGMIDLTDAAALAVDKSLAAEHYGKSVVRRLVRPNLSCRNLPKVQESS